MSRVTMQTVVHMQKLQLRQVVVLMKNEMIFKL